MRGWRDKAPDSLTVDGKDYKINTGFRGCILTFQALQAGDLTDWERTEILLENIYCEPPDNIPEAVERAIWFLSGGKPQEKSDKPQIINYDFEQDADLIYSAFLKKNVDLDSVDMHWWTFLSHFAELPESAFTYIAYLRTQYKRGKLTKEERKDCDRIGWDVIKMLTEEQRAENERIWAALKDEDSAFEKEFEERYKVAVERRDREKAETEKQQKEFFEKLGKPQE